MQAQNEVKIGNKTYVNLTPHVIKVYNREATRVIIEIPPMKDKNKVPRVAVSKTIVDSIDIDNARIYIKKAVYGSVENMPPPKPDHVYIVSLITAQAIAQHQLPYDVIVPDTNNDSVVRDKNDKIDGVRGFLKV